MKNIHLLLVLFISIGISANDIIQLSFTFPQKVKAYAGVDKKIAVGDSTELGGSPAASNGFFPYQYSWYPKISISDSLLQNPSVNPGRSLTYFLKVTDSIGCSSIDAVYVSVYKNGKLIQEGDVALSVEEPNQSSFKIYPNPTRDKLKIDLEGFYPQNAIVQIRSLTGVVLSTHTISTSQPTHTIDINNLQKGIYLIDIKIGKEHFFHKLVIE